jgi:hypothetical protein
MSIRLTVPADFTANLHGHSTAVAGVQVTNSGTETVTVSGSVANISPKAQAHPAAAWITSISPRSETIRPGHSGTLTLHIAVPAGHTAGSHFANVLVHVRPAGHGQVREVSGVGGTLKITHPGSAVAVPAHPAQPVATSSGLGAGGIAIIVLVALLLATVAAVLVRRHNRTEGGTR